MLNFREYRKNPDRLSDLLPWAALVAEGVILNKDGSLQTTHSFRGPDLDSATPEELVSISARINNVLKRLGSGWAIYCDAHRTKSSSYPLSTFPEPISYLIDEERRALFEKHTHFESHYYLTLVYLPPADSESKFSQFFLKDSDSEKANYTKILDSFLYEASRIGKLLGSLFPESSQLGDEESLTYLHSLVSEKRHRITPPATPMYLDALISDTPLIAGFSPVLGEHHLKVISIKGFPSFSTPGILDQLNRLSIEYRWCSRFIAMNKTEQLSEIKRYQRQWFAKRKSPLIMLKETMWGTESIMQDSDAIAKAQDADAAHQEVAQDLCSFGWYTSSVVLMDKDKDVLKANTEDLERVILSSGISLISESANAVDAWLGTLPGNCRNNVRRPLLSTLNFSHLMPLSAVWAGPRRNDHLDGPPLFEALTSGTTKFRFVNFVGDVGHTMIIGPTGSGKSVLLNFMALQFLRYEDAQVYIFDKGGSARFVTAAVGGEHYDLGSDKNDVVFQPLGSIDRMSERRWSNEWLIDLFTQVGVTVTPHLKEQLWTALESLATAPAEQRTIFGLSVLLQSEELRQALLAFTLKGPHGYLLDNKRETLSLKPWLCFEMEELIRNKSAAMPVLSYLFHRLEERFDGRPTLLILDEAWLFLDHEAFSKKLREWLKVLRKKNVAVVFASQSLADVIGSNIAATIREACHTRIFLPNISARSDTIIDFYRTFGLNNTQIRIITEASPKRHYYYQSMLGNRLFELALGELALAYCGATGEVDQKTLRKLQSQTDKLNELNRNYLNTKGITWAVEALDCLNNQRSVA